MTRFTCLLFFFVVFPFFCCAQSVHNIAVGKNGGTVSIKKFGGRGDGKFNNTMAFQKASAYLQQYGGTLLIEKGVYMVGGQKQSGRYTAGYAFSDESILSFKDAKHPIIIKGKNAVIKAVKGLRFGSFNPVTGLQDSIRKEGNRSSYYASAYIFIHAIGCASIEISGLTIDGNSSTLNIGPAFDKEGIQLMATGIRLYNNRKALVSNCYIHHCGLDALLIGWTGLTTQDTLYPHVIKNVKAKFNGRQGISWVGGNSLRVYDSEFSGTGKALNKGKPVVSKPAAGIDIEIEESIIRNGYFYNCRIYDNAGPGLSSIGHDTYNINFIKCTFIGTTNSAAYPKSQGFSFDGCTFVGKVERIFGSQDKSKAISFKNCLFTMDKKKSPNGRVFGDRCEFYEGDNVIIESSVFNAADRRLPVFSNREITFINCSFSQNNAQDFKAAGVFKGTTKFHIKGGGKMLADEAQTEGTVIYNDKQVESLKKLP